MTDRRRRDPVSAGDTGTGPAGEIRARFRDLYPQARYGDLASRIGRYWIETLARAKERRSAACRSRDLEYDRTDPLSRIVQRAVIIAYADSVFEKGRASLEVLDEFLGNRFPAVGGLHLLPACTMAEDRFNDGGFSQIRRDRIHARFGTNERFKALMEKYVSMTDLVLNHVDMDHPMFRRYLAGDDAAGRCFYVFSESQFRERKARGDFDAVFRPRPFPLFTLFRRDPRGDAAGFSPARRREEMNLRFQRQGLARLPDLLIDLLAIFDKIRNDQMLLAADAAIVRDFREALAAGGRLDPDALFILSKIQETRHPPYIFAPSVATQKDFMNRILPTLDLDPKRAGEYAAAFRQNEAAVFGEPVRALTTFSHVQVDVNTGTFEGLKLLADDLAWYLSQDLNMLRLDAANFAFKKWGTACFGLPEVQVLMEIIYLSMAEVAPRMVPNLEVNAPLSIVLARLAEDRAPPPMIYDFHLACMLPVVFNEADARPLTKIAPLMAGFDLPADSIRFSLDESHDGKSVSGSGGADPLLTFAQRRALAAQVVANGGHVKYKGVPKGRMDPAEFAKVCAESGLDPGRSSKALFRKPDAGAPVFRLKTSLATPEALAAALGVAPDRFSEDAALAFLAEKLLHGREPYELCISTRDCLTRLADPVLEVRRYLAFKTLGFALMARNAKAEFFNDLIGLPNDPERVRRTGELRNIKRTRSEAGALAAVLDDPARCEYWISRMMNNTLALIDNDPALSPRGAEARVWTPPDIPAVAVVANTCGDHVSLAVINVAARRFRFDLEPSAFALDTAAPLYENISRTRLASGGRAEPLHLDLPPFARQWITRSPIPIPPGAEVFLPEPQAMARALAATVRP